MMGYTNKKMKLEKEEDNNSSLGQQLDDARTEHHTLKQTLDQTKRAVHELIRAELQRIKLHPSDTIRDALRTVGLNHSIRDPALVILFRDAVTEAGFEWQRVTHFMVSRAHRSDSFLADAEQDWRKFYSKIQEAVLEHNAEAAANEWLPMGWLKRLLD
jgi:hypothetical protein